jgi:hypothetical protein
MLSSALALGVAAMPADAFWQGEGGLAQQIHEVQTVHVDRLAALHKHGRLDEMGEGELKAMQTIAALGYSVLKRQGQWVHEGQADGQAKQQAAQANDGLTAFDASLSRDVLCPGETTDLTLTLVNDAGDDEYVINDASIDDCYYDSGASELRCPTAAFVGTPSVTCNFAYTGTNFYNNAGKFSVDGGYDGAYTVWFGGDPVFPAGGICTVTMQIQANASPLASVSSFVNLYAVSGCCPNYGGSSQLALTVESCAAVEPQEPQSINGGSSDNTATGTVVTAVTTGDTEVTVAVTEEPVNTPAGAAVVFKDVQDGVYFFDVQLPATGVCTPFSVSFTATPPFTGDLVPVVTFDQGYYPDPPTVNTFDPATATWTVSGTVCSTAATAKAKAAQTDGLGFKVTFAAESSSSDWAPIVGGVIGGFVCLVVCLAIVAGYCSGAPRSPPSRLGPPCTTPMPTTGRSP